MICLTQAYSVWTSCFLLRAGYYKGRVNKRDTAAVPPPPAAAAPTPASATAPAPPAAATAELEKEQSYIKKL
jgi:hypothetical protein